VVALLCVAVFVVVSIGIPLSFMRPYLRDQELHWPGFRLIERSKVAVGDGAFRDAQAVVERQRDIAPGVPWAVKITSFLAMYCGQFFPVLGMYAVLGVLTSVVYFAEFGALTGLNVLIGIVGTGLWTMAARSGWKASTAVLGGETQLAEASLQRSVLWHLATLATMGAAALFGAARARDVTLLAITAPFFALAALAFLQQAVFRKHKSKLPDAVGEPALNAHGFTVLGVRVQTVADTPSAQVHESDVHAAAGQRGQGQR
jgi:hypothetical protein